MHRRAALRGWETTRRHGIPVTAPATTLADLAADLPSNEVEDAINQADKRGVIDPERLRSMLERLPSRPGVGALGRILDRRTFVLMDSELERRFVTIVRRAGPPEPQTGVYLNGLKVDFYWPDLGLVAETDGLRYHRTPAQQAKDHVRDQTHTAAGLTSLRFTHQQVRYESAAVEATLTAVIARLTAD